MSTFAFEKRLLDFRYYLFFLRTAIFHTIISDRKFKKGFRCLFEMLVITPLLHLYFPLMVCITIYLIGMRIEAEISLSLDKIVVEIENLSLSNNDTSQNTNPLIDSFGFKYATSGSSLIYAIPEFSGKNLRIPDNVVPSPLYLSMRRSPVLYTRMEGERTGSRPSKLIDDIENEAEEILVTEMSATTKDSE